VLREHYLGIEIDDVIRNWDHTNASAHVLCQAATETLSAVPALVTV